MSILIQDLRFAFRVIRRNLLTSGIIVMTLGLGIGANTAMFAAFDAWVLRPLDFDQPERLVALHETRTALGKSSRVAPANLRDWQEASRSFEAIVPFRRTEFNLQTANAPERVEGARIDAKLFPFLGVDPIRGRHFLPAEDLPNGPPVALISHETWQRRYDSDPAVVGRTVRLDGTLHTIVGVMPPGFEFPEWAHVWAPLGLDPSAAERDERELSVVARLKRDVGLDQAQIEMTSVAERLAVMHPESNAGWSVEVQPLREEWAPPVIRLAISMSMVIAGAVLLVICANVANLLMAQTARRRREVALRTALGAGRRRLIRQTLTESLVLASAGGAVGAALGGWWVEWMLSWAPVSPPYLFRFEVDGRALIFTLAIAVATGLVCAVATVTRGAGLDIGECLKSGGGRTASAGGGQALRRMLVVSEFAVTMLLLVGALLMVKSFVRAQLIDSGYRTDGILTLRLSLEGDAFEDAGHRARAVDEIVNRVSGLTGVESAGAASRLPVSRWGYRQVRLETESGPSRPGEQLVAGYTSVTRGFLETLELPLLEGRGFNASETEGAEVALVSRSLAEMLWPNEQALGRHLRLEGSASWLRVVGVTGDIDPGQSMTQGNWPRTQVYAPWGHDPEPLASLVVRGAAEPLSYVPQVREILGRVHSGVSVVEAMTVRHAVDQVHWVSSFFSRLFTYYALIALIIAALGAYGVLADSVAQRRREMGVRLALGAQPGDLLKLVVRQGVGFGVAGVVLGLVLAIPAARFLTSMLYQVSASDPTVFGGVALLLVGVAYLAAYLPARRAARVDPMEVLRFE